MSFHYDEIAKAVEVWKEAHASEDKWNRAVEMQAESVIYRYLRPSIVAVPDTVGKLQMIASQLVSYDGDVFVFVDDDQILQAPAVTQAPTTEYVGVRMPYALLKRIYLLRMMDWAFEIGHELGLQAKREPAPACPACGSSERFVGHVANRPEGACPDPWHYK